VFVPSGIAVTLATGNEPVNVVDKCNLTTSVCTPYTGTFPAGSYEHYSPFQETCAAALRDDTGVTVFMMIGSMWMLDDETFQGAVEFRTDTESTWSEVALVTTRHMGCVVTIANMAYCEQSARAHDRGCCLTRVRARRRRRSRQLHRRGRRVSDVRRHRRDRGARRRAAGERARRHAVAEARRTGLRRCRRQSHTRNVGWRVRATCALARVRVMRCVVHQVVLERQLGGR
jgi:hypothetical protein